MLDSRPATLIREEIGYSGPLPDPHTFGIYDQVLPGAADRILTMAERNQAHRHFLAEKTLKWGMRLALVGQICSSVIGLGGVAAGFVLVLKDKPVTGLATVITSLAVLAGIYLNGQRFLSSKTAPKGESPTSK